LGLNCSVGPQVMLDAIERIANVTSKKLSVQPNAGKPRSVEGRNIYLGSPEYMASYAKKSVQYGVRIVGGCCGTTPQHIKAIRTAVKSVGVAVLGPSPGAPARWRSTHPPPGGEGTEAERQIPLKSRSRLGRKLSTKEFIKIVEMIPPVGHDFAKAIEKAKYLQAQDVDAINVPDAP